MAVLACSVAEPMWGVTTTCNNSGQLSTEKSVDSLNKLSVNLPWDVEREGVRRVAALV